MDIIAEIFIESCKKQLEKNIEIFKSIKILMKEHVVKLIERKYEVMEEFYQKENKIKRESFKQNFRQFIKLTYGQVLEYGLEEDIS
jgi:hypothetical protein